jgi:hypothetical protein
MLIIINKKNMTCSQCSLLFSLSLYKVYSELGARTIVDHHQRVVKGDDFGKLEFDPRLSVS